MKYAEFETFSQQERARILQSLPDEEVANLLDQKPYELPAFTPKAGLQYFDTIEDLHGYLLTDYVPASKPWLADEYTSHELRHAECAIAVGAVGVKYYALKEPDPTTRNSGIYTQAYGPAEIPNLALAAIAAHPYNAAQSLADTRVIRSCAYRSRGHVAERIATWNSKGNDLLIPVPQTVPIAYP